MGKVKTTFSEFRLLLFWKCTMVYCEVVEVPRRRKSLTFSQYGLLEFKFHGNSRSTLKNIDGVSLNVTNSFRSGKKVTGLFLCRSQSANNFGISAPRKKLKWRKSTSFKPLFRMINKHRAHQSSSSFSCVSCWKWSTKILFVSNLNLFVMAICTFSKN